MTGFLTLILGILEMMNSGAHRFARVEGVPVGIGADPDYWLVSCVDPPGVFLIDRNDWTMAEYPADFIEPQGAAFLQGVPFICDRGADRLLTGFPESTSEIPTPGGPFSVVTVDWRGDGIREPVVTLRDAGKVVIVTGSETVTLAELPGARGLAVATDVFGDGREGLFVAGCGTGLHLIRNMGGSPSVYHLGNIGDGVKAVVSADMDGDGYPDAVGIACSEGGAFWFRNPGYPRGSWDAFELDRGIRGPKGVTGGFGGILVASLFSRSGLYTLNGHRELPRGCVSCAFDPEGNYALGHVSGLVAEFRSGPVPEGSSPPNR